MAWRQTPGEPEHAAKPHHARVHKVARRVVRVPILVGVILLSFGAGIGAGALTHQETTKDALAEQLAGEGLGLMTVTPPPLTDDSTPDAPSGSDPSGAPSGDPDAEDPEKKSEGETDEKPVDPEERDETGLSLSDRDAGILEAGTPRSAGGELLRVPGESKAPGSGELVRVRVEVEEGLPVDGVKFAETVMTILNDEQGWGYEGTVTFARVEGEADMRVVLASPAKVDEMCAPLDTAGKYSCGRYGHAAINYTRWVEATEEFASRTQYRQYVVNHEVGHLLGKQHVSCTGPGELAPIMQQQSIRVAPCEPNGWPFPDTSS
ncbi:MAG: DUF3152 domain-containing protein [Actinomycetota bacterium]|nr:DUF3152 domain-containing protein [Actinomycetota bacterium]